MANNISARLNGRIVLVLAAALVALSAFLFVGMAHGGSTAYAQEPCGGKAEGANDPCGDKTGTGIDIVGEDGEFDETVVLDAIGKTKIGVNFTWTLLAGALVLFFQGGFALVETGFTRAKNAAHTMMMNFVIFAIGGVAWFITGFALMFGGVGGLAALGGGTAVLDGITTLGGADWGIFGNKGWFLAGDSYDVGVMTLWFFQLVFMDTAGTIVTGAMAERWKFSAFIVYSFFMAGFLYPLFGNWAWGGGWLAHLGLSSDLGHGYVDFAGSGVVHAVGGLSALAGAIVIGPRIGKYGSDGKVNTIPGHSIPLAILGVFILLFGWLGFNAGSTLSGTDLRIASVIVNTVIASCSGLLVAMFVTWWWKGAWGKPDPGMACNGMLAGLVAITAPSGFVAPWAAFVIGAFGGLFVVLAYRIVDTVLKIDDPVGAFSVHGVNGLWGVIAVGLFADGTYGAGWNGVEGTVTGLFYGDSSQLGAQLIGVLTLIIWAFGGTFIFMKIQDMFFGIRVSAEVEVQGLDIHEMGARAYEFGDTPTPPGPSPVGAGGMAIGGGGGGG
ncbi:MAG TPA: ammonium transporter [Dehalococcoidia bacterium]|nr:ammonium transporter [Dehalococcoidia bacterium]